MNNLSKQQKARLLKDLKAGKDVASSLRALAGRLPKVFIWNEHETDKSIVVEGNGLCLKIDEVEKLFPHDLNVFIVPPNNED